MSQINNKLHLGCGSVNFPGWINIDLDSPTADMLLDLTHPLPFPDGSATHMFNEHFIEHITRSQAVQFLQECHRVLSADGAIRITTPNLRFLTYSYMTGAIGEWGDLWQPNTRCMMLNEGMRSWGHQFVYDAEELVEVLVEAGFRTVSFQSYRDSADQMFRGLESRPFHNELIIEARKSDVAEVQVDFDVVTKNEADWINSLSTYNPPVQEQKLARVEQESLARAQFIDTQAAHILKMEENALVQAQAIEAQVAHALKVAEESSKQAQVIEMLELRIGEAEAELEVFRSSWCGKLKSLFNRTK